MCRLTNVTLWAMFLALAGCAADRSMTHQYTDNTGPLADSTKSHNKTTSTPGGRHVRDLLDAGRYHAAMQRLPKEMGEWKRKTDETGKSFEGARGFLKAHTLMRVATNGDSHWGAILDDPDIPYIYKTELLHEILTYRLGKGSVYQGNDDNLIVPRHEPIELDNMIELPDND